jgi:hypothetical protein
VIVFNKSDLEPRGTPAISALRETGLDELVESALDRLEVRPVREGAAVVFTERQRRWIDELAGDGRARALDELLHGRIR